MRWPVHITTARAGREARGVVAPGGPTSGPWRPLRDCRQRRRCRLPSAAAAATAAAAASPHRLWGESASGPVGVFLCLAWTSFTSPGPGRPVLPLSPPSRARSWQVLRECLTPALPFPTPPPPSVGAVLAVGRWRPAVSDTLCLPFPPSGASRPPTGGYPVWLYAPPVGRVSFYPLPKRSCAGAADCVGPPPAPSLPLLGEAGLGRAAGRGGDRVGSVDGGHSVQNRLARVW